MCVVLRMIVLLVNYRAVYVARSSVEVVVARMNVQLIFKETEKRKQSKFLLMAVDRLHTARTSYI